MSSGTSGGENNRGDRTIAYTPAVSFNWACWPISQTLAMPRAAEWSKRAWLASQHRFDQRQARVPKSGVQHCITHYPLICAWQQTRPASINTLHNNSSFIHQMSFKWDFDSLSQFVGPGTTTKPRRHQEAKARRHWNGNILDVDTQMSRDAVSVVGWLHFGHLISFTNLSFFSCLAQTSARGVIPAIRRLMTKHVSVPIPFSLLTFSITTRPKEAFVYFSGIRLPKILGGSSKDFFTLFRIYILPHIWEEACFCLLVRKLVFCYFHRIKTNLSFFSFFFWTLKRECWRGSNWFRFLLGIYGIGWNWRLEKKNSMEIWIEVDRPFVHRNTQHKQTKYNMANSQ